MTAREYRLEQVCARIAELGGIDKEQLRGEIQKTWGVSGTTARLYIDDLIRRGSIVSRFGILRSRFEFENSEARTIEDDLKAFEEAKRRSLKP